MRCISEEKCIAGRRHLACRCELAEGDQSLCTRCETAFIYKMIVDLCIHNDTCCEKYCKWSDTNGELIGVLLLLEYHTTGKGSANQIQGTERMVVCLYTVVAKIIRTPVFSPAKNAVVCQ